SMGKHSLQRFTIQFSARLRQLSIKISVRCHSSVSATLCSRIFPPTLLLASLRRFRVGMCSGPRSHAQRRSTQVPGNSLESLALLGSLLVMLGRGLGATHASPVDDDLACVVN